VADVIYALQSDYPLVSAPMDPLVAVWAAVTRHAGTALSGTLLKSDK